MAKQTKRKKTAPNVIDFEIALPTKWEQLTSHQVTRVAYHMSENLPKMEVLIRIALEFADLKPHGARVEPDGAIAHLFYSRTKGNIPLSSDQVAALALAMEWLDSPATLTSAPIVDDYQIPDHRLYGITLEQFITADSACNAFFKTKSIEPLRVMVAALYPRTGKFAPETLARQARRLSYIPQWNLEAVTIWYVGVKKWLSDKYPFVFSNNGSQNTNELSGVEVMLNLLSSLNDGRVVDNDKIKATEIHEALYELNNKIRIYQENR